MNVYTTGPRSSSRAVVVMTRKKDPRKQIYPDYLVHYGIFGQKWGVRRYQNEDGTLTEEGKERYNQKPESENWKKSDAEHLSDEELRRRNNRLQAERQYKDLTTKEVERERAQFRQNLKSALLKAALITPVVALVGVYAKKRLGVGVDMISKFAKKKIAPLKAAGIMKSTLKNANVPSTVSYNPFANLGKHVGRINKNMISSSGPKVFENGVYANPLLKNRAYWRGLGRI